jgi:hypothetical protein
MRRPRLSSFAFLFSLIKERYFLSERQKRYRDYFAGKNASRGGESLRPVVVALQCVEDIGWFSLFALLVTQMRQLKPVRADLYILRSLRAGSSLSLRALFWNTAISNFLSDNSWKRLYFSFCDRVAYRSTAWMAPWTELRILWKARQIWRGLDSTDALANLTVSGIQIGDLVIDSYLRFKPSPMVRLSDRYLGVVIRQALQDTEKAFRYFRAAKPDFYFTSYTTYVQHGVAARVAAACGVRVLSFGNFQDFSKVITRADHYQTKASAGYAAEFSRLPDRAAKIAAAEKSLSARVAGQIDASTAYMKASAWQGRTETPQEVRGSLVIFLHDFYDSLHIYPGALFHDFWTWLCFTVEVLDRHGIPFFIKPHPNQIDASDEAIAELRRKYPDLRILPSEVNNRQLAEGGIAGVVTVFGTISSEMAYLGIPTISCGDNPHASFAFCQIARSRTEYEAMLKDFQIPQVSREEMRDQACAFFYMHNLNLAGNALDLRDRSIKLRMNIWSNPDRSAEEVLADIQEFGAAASFKAFCKELIHDLAPRR